MAFVLLAKKLLITKVSSFCKKCFVAKPPRCHHCSVCDRCILKMDHHCPWLNNCIGHYNHRYFFFFCAYTWLGTIFVMIFGVWVAFDHWFPDYSPFETIDFDSYDDVTENHIWPIEFVLWSNQQRIKSKLMIFEAIITVLLFLLLGLLLRYHIDLITNGETCIEKHINRKCRKHFAELDIVYQNPYDFGSKQNWRNFLGFDRTNNPWRHILLPSNLKPIGDGFNWETTISRDN
ncbi:prolyl endopeptidase [Sarcoptes scabiei]|uniref:Palmitoyltransferase n=1 Tax=Sarcoptes scabiei TaxID=52283 RepID=A0A132A341_SARSC|nr:zinc finger domain-containing protein 11 [Sarcoptes scabiei]UXI20539.1 prolyl endopeptidase [Sarcoptes scabiei]